MLQNTEEQDRDFFAKECASKMCSAFKQNVTIMILGVLGGGKSYLALELARLISIYVAQKLGGKPEEYFNLKENCGIMIISDIEKVYEKMDNTEKQIFIIDDSSPTFSARDFMTEENKALNNRIITIRPHSHCVIFTTPAKSLMDIVVRKMSGYQVFIKEPLFEIGKVVCDVRRVKVDLISDKEKTYRPQLQNHRGQKYRLHIFNKPPDEWCDIYDARRAAAQKILAAESRATIEAGMKTKEPKENKTEIYIKHHERYYRGDFGAMTAKESCELEGISYDSFKSTISKLKKNNLLKGSLTN